MQKILLHGLGQTPSDWEYVKQYLSEPQEIDTPDLFALTNGKEINYENMFQGFTNYCNSLDDQLQLCGISLGAILALNYAIENPKRVHSLLLIAPQFKMPKLLLTIQNSIFRIMPEKYFNEANISKRDMICLTNSMKHLDLSNRIKRVDCPVLIACGVRDKANKKAAVQLCREIPDSKLHFIENSGHEINKDAPSALANLISGFE